MANFVSGMADERYHFATQLDDKIRMQIRIRVLVRDNARDGIPVQVLL